MVYASLLASQRGSAKFIVDLRLGFQATRIGQRERSGDHRHIAGAPHVWYAPIAAVRLHPAAEYRRGLSPGPRSGGSQHDAGRNAPGRTPLPPTTSPAEPNVTTTGSLRRQASASPDASPSQTTTPPPVAKLADDDDRVREVAVRPGAEAPTLLIIGIAVKRGLAVGANGYQVNAG